MSITSMEELEALEAGAAVLLRSALNGDQRWERVEGGFKQPEGTTVVKPAHFVGYLSGGLVQREDRPMFAEGALLAVGDYHLLLVDQREGAWRCVQFYRGRINSNPTMPEETIRTARYATVPTEQIPGLASITVLARMYYQQVDLGRARSAATASRVQEVVPPGLVAALHNYAAEVDGPADGDLDSILTQYGIGRVADHVSTVSISGTTTLGTDYDEVAERLTDGRPDRDLVIDDVSDLVVRWSKQVRVTRSTVGGECWCDNVEQSDLDQYVPANADRDDWSFEATCAD